VFKLSRSFIFLAQFDNFLLINLDRLSIHLTHVGDEVMLWNTENEKTSVARWKMYGRAMRSAKTVKTSKGRTVITGGGELRLATSDKPLQVTRTPNRHHGTSPAA